MKITAIPLGHRGKWYCDVVQTFCSERTGEDLYLHENK